MPLPPEEVGRRIRAARIKKGLTVRQLSELMNVDWRTIQRWQAGVDSKTGKPTLPRVTGEKSLLRLAEVLEVPPGHLVEMEDPQASLQDLARQVEGLAGEMKSMRGLLDEALADAQGRAGKRRPRAAAPQRGQ